MPTQKPVVSYTRIREYAERFDWTDRYGRQHTGLNPPSDAIDKRHHPFDVTFLTSSGVAYQATVVCTTVMPAIHSRDLMFVTDGVQPGCSAADAALMKKIPRGETRRVSDMLIVEIDGVRFSTH